MAIHRLRPGDIKGLIENAPRTKHSDGGGLILQVNEVGQASWVFRYKDASTGRERWPCIGPAATYTLDEAREKARLARIELKEGRSAFDYLTGGAAEPAGKLFSTALREYLAEKSPTWKDSNRARELRRYDFLFGQIPTFTKLPLRSITQDHKNKALSNWAAGSKQRRDVGFYIEAVLSYAEKGYLRLKKTREVDHHADMPYADVPAFFQRLAKLDTVDARALQWTILTGARTDETIGGAAKPPATWAEIVEVDSLPVWDIPGERMKNGLRHRVPLTDQMVALLGERQDDNVPLFEVSSQNGMLNTLKRTNGNGFTVHGFRTSFTEYATKELRVEPDLADRCISHETRGKVRRAYQRDDLLEMRREIMSAWSDYVAVR
jgi:integrase